ncbi:MAG: GNAT family N-acetyltransferase [Bythopirellula sp.]|nr:GNAT family N-acetyltransferase [Bythopirellula sp.]
MPLPHIILPMSIDEYHVMDHRLGWKHEYWDGAARLSCQPTAVTTFKLDVAAYSPRGKKLANEFMISRDGADDVPSLVDLFLRAFDDGIEFAGYDQTSYLRAAQKSIHSLTGETPSAELEHSFLTVKDDAVIAAGLVRRGKCGPILEPIMVEPQYQRLGFGTAILSEIVRSLLTAREPVLHSRCHLGNPASLQWHEQNGFREVPDLFAAGHRALHYHWRARHFASRNQPKLASEMQRLAEKWERIAEIEQLPLMQRQPN